MLENRVLYSFEKINSDLKGTKTVSRYQKPKNGHIWGFLKFILVIFCFTRSSACSFTQVLSPSRPTAAPIPGVVEPFLNLTFNFTLISAECIWGLNGSRKFWSETDEIGYLLLLKLFLAGYTATFHGHQSSSEAVPVDQSLGRTSYVQRCPSLNGRS